MCYSGTNLTKMKMFSKDSLINLFPSCPEAFVVDRAVRGEVNSHDVARAHLYHVD